MLDVLPSGGELFLLTFDRLLKGIVVRLASLQAEPVTVARLDSREDPQSVVAGQLVRHGAQRLIGVVPGGRYELHVFNREGGRAAIRSRVDTSFPLVDSPPGLFPVRRSPRNTVLAQLELPDGRFMAQVASYEEVSPDHSRGAAALEILDESFSLLETVAGPHLGRLAGVSNDGALYFMDIRPSGGRLVKAKLLAAE